MKTCLVVEDNAIIREITVTILTELGLKAIEFSNASEAVAHCGNEKPDLVMLDWDLPAMGALDFLQGAGKLTEEQRPQILICATENDPQQFALAKAAGARYYLLKPFDKIILSEKLIELGLLKSLITEMPDGRDVQSGDSDSSAISA